MKYALILILLISANASFAKNTKQQINNIGAKLSTEHAFSGLDVNGRYQSAHEGLSTVENEKPILDILDYPKTYTDRIKQSKKWVR